MRGIGLDIPIQRGSNGYFQQTFDNTVSAKVRIKNLFNTIEGERYMNPTFGMNLYKYIFEISGYSDVEQEITDYIRSNIERWLPDIVVNSINMSIDDSNTVYTININYSIISNLDENFDTQFEIVGG